MIEAKNDSTYVDQDATDESSPKGDELTTAHQNEGQIVIHTSSDSGARESQPLSGTISSPATATDPTGVEQLSVHEQLYSAATEIQRCALRAQAKRSQAQREIALQENGSSSKGIEHKMKDIEIASRKNEKAVQLAQSTANAINLRTVVTWYVDYLFGDKGLENLHQCLNSVQQDQGADVYKTPTDDDSTPSAMMHGITCTYQKLIESSKVRGNAYQERLLEFIHFCNRQTTFWERCFVHESPERDALLAYWHVYGRSTYAQGAGWKAKPGNQIGVLLRQWIEKATGHTWATIQNEVWIGRHLKGMVRMFGHGVLCFMDTDLEDRLVKLPCSCLFLDTDILFLQIKSPQKRTRNFCLFHESHRNHVRQRLT